MSPLAPQKVPYDSGAKVTEEIRNPMGWIVGRTYRLSKLLEIPEIQEMIQRVVSHLDNYCAVEEIEANDLQGDVLPTRALRYITIRLGGRPCWACEGRGVEGNGYIKCRTCSGTGVR